VATDRGSSTAQQGRRIFVGVTGASGAPYAVALLRRDLGDVYLALSGWGRMVMREETGLREADLQPLVRRIFSDKDLANPFSSGSNAFDAMVVVPCSLTTMAKIAAGIADTLITRAAMVALKERRRLVLVVREAPWPTSAFENAARLSREGVVIIPASPPFYHRPETLEQLIEQFVDKVVGVLGCEPRRRWREEVLEASRPVAELTPEERQALGLPGGDGDD
jgi:4-hydroxy-3-polyprenylbenzoate decarboxylase